MTPLHKALELYHYYDYLIKDFTKGCSVKLLAKQSAIKVCNEVLGYIGSDRGSQFWSEVKSEIEKL